MKIEKIAFFFLVLLLILLSGCGNEEVEPNGKPLEIIPAPVGEISEEDRALLEVNEKECNTGEEFVPKVKYTWKWGDIGTDFCEEYFCDATQFSIVLLKKINNIIDTKQIEDGLEFEVFLMKDGFEGSFQKDFDNYMRNKNFLDTPSFYLNEKIGELFADKEKFVFAASEIGKPGKYKIKVTYSKNISERIAVEFEFISSNVLNNPFYYIPFNGRIGDKRQGYGLGYNLANETSQVTVSEELSISSQSTTSGKFNATVKKVQDFGAANALETRGIVLKLEANPFGKNRTIEFSPLLATPVLMHSKANTSNANSIALLYRISDQGTNEIVPNDSFLLWYPLEQCLVYNRSTKPVIDARNTGEPKGYMIFNDLNDLEGEKINGNVYYKSTIYTPKQVTLTSLGTYIDNKLEEQATLEFKTPFSSSETVSLSGAPQILHNNSQDMIQSMEQTFESIRKGEMCIQKTGDAKSLEARVYWNEEKLFERIGSQIDVARQQCVFAETLGEQKTAVILVNFSNNPVELYTKEYVYDQVFSENTSFQHFPHTVNEMYKEQSFGKMWLTGDVYGWFTLPLNQNILELDSNLSLKEYSDLIFLETIKISDSQIFFPNYEKIVVIVASVNSTGPPRGFNKRSAEYQTNDGTITVPVAFTFREDFGPSLGPVSHEFGHTLGLRHANDLECGELTIAENCESIEYGDGFDMGHFNAIYKEFLGWFEPENILTVIHSSGTYELKPLELPTNEIQVIKIPVQISAPLPYYFPDEGTLYPIATSQFYYLEYRRPVGLDSYFDNLDGIFVHLDMWYKNKSYNSVLLDLSPNKTTNEYSQIEDSTDVVLRKGETFIDSINGISITVNDISEDEAVISINFSTEISDKYEKILNDPRIQNAIEANPLVESDDYKGITEIILQKINEIETGNTNNWNDYRYACPHSLQVEERNRCLRDIYLRKVALSLYVEVNEIVPWKLLDYDDEELAILLGDLNIDSDVLSGYYVTRSRPTYNGNPIIAFEYVQELKSLYPDRPINTQKDLLDLILIRMRDEGWIHASASDTDSEEICDYYIYDLECLLSWKKGSDIFMAEVIYALLQSYNVPTLEEPRYLGGHTGIIFPSLSLAMQGNDVYSGFKAGVVIKPNSLPVEITFLDLEIYNEWNKLDRCEAAHKIARKNALDYLNLYNNNKWSQDIKAYYCLGRAGAEPGEIMREGITNNEVPWDCKPKENLDAIGEMEPPLTEQELDEWMEKISQVTQC